MKKTSFFIDGAYSDEFGNKIIVGDSTEFEKVKVEFRGKNNTLIFAAENKSIKNLNIEFSSESGALVIGNITAIQQIRGNIRVGYHSLVVIGDKVTATKPVFICASEQTKILIGEDCMFATDNHVRTDDAHAIYDVNTGQRLNVSKDIIIGAHVWIAYAAKVYGGACIGSGTVVGTNSIVKKTFPNNCTIVGAPAVCVRKDIAWERPNVARHKPWIRENSDHVYKHPKLWQKTDEQNIIPYLGDGFDRLFDLLSKHSVYFDVDLKKIYCEK